MPDSESGALPLGDIPIIIHLWRCRLLTWIHRYRCHFTWRYSNIESGWIIEKKMFFSSFYSSIFQQRIRCSISKSCWSFLTTHPLSHSISDFVTLPFSSNSCETRANSCFDLCIRSLYNSKYFFTSSRRYNFQSSLWFCKKWDQSFSTFGKLYGFDQICLSQYSMIRWINSSSVNVTNIASVFLLIVQAVLCLPSFTAKLISSCTLITRTQPQFDHHM